MNEEIKRILKMVQDGKLEIEKASELIEVLKEEPKQEIMKEVPKQEEIKAEPKQEGVKKEAPKKEEPKQEKRNLEKEPIASSQKEAPKERVLRMRITSENSEIINVNFPLGFIKSMLCTFGSIPTIHMDGLSGININSMNDSILEAIDKGQCGKIIDIKGPDGDTIEMWIE